MSIGTKITRLLAAAKEFNVGRETLVAFLKGGGFDIDDSKPNPRISVEMYEAMQGEFAQDKAVKRKSDSIELPKGSLLENLNKSKEELTLPVKDKKVEKILKPADDPIVEKTKEPKEEIIESDELIEEKSKVEKKETEIVEKQMEDSSQQKIDSEEPSIEPSPSDKEEKVNTPPEEKTEEVKEPEITASPETIVPPQEEKKEEVKEEVEKENSTETEKPKVEKEDKVSVIKPDEESKEQDKKEEEEEIQHIEFKSPKLEGPKILDKINLEALNLSTRPKKSVTPQKVTPKKTVEPVKPAPKTEDKKVAAPKPTPTKAEDKPKTVTVPNKITIKPATPPAESENEEVVREHIAMNAPRLEGPRVVGKIELPVSSGGKQDRNEKKKRKRIPVEKKAGTVATPRTGTPRTPGTPGGQRGPARGPAGSAPGQGQQAPGNRNAPRRGPAGNQPNRRGRAATPNVPQEIDAKEIQDKIRETQAKLAGGGARNRNLKARYRRNKRDELADKRAAAEAEAENNVIQVTEFISVSEFANLLNVSFADVISKCMNLGIMVSINQRLDAEVIELVASEFDTEVEFINLEDGVNEEIEEVDAEEDLENRAPIVTIMGHVDHGKTSLLDYIRNATVVAGEAGGITQHIGAYRVTTEAGKNLTFLDTPGHEAFTAMRARGAKVADVAIIVIAADDAIMPQTREAISHAQAAGLPMVFAINKIDKEAANPEKIKEQLSSMNILVEDWGGKFQSQEISAKKGLNIDLLLEKVLLESELLELKANPNREAAGSIIEAELDKGRGYVSTVLVQNGELNAGDLIVSGQYYGKVRAMMNERGHRVKTAGPSTPVQVLGLNGAPQAGERFKVFTDESEAKNLATHRAQIMREQGLRSRKHITLDEIGRRLALGNFKELNVIIKADYDGSAEALSDSLQKLSTDEIVVNVVLKGVGQITESDVNLASASDAIIIGFQVRPSVQASKLAEMENIEIRNYSIIYDAIAELKSAMEGMLEPKFEKKVVGNIEVRETYKISSLGTIAGCYVLDGKFSRNTHINIIRDGIVVHTGELASLKRFKDDVKEVSAGYECGLSIKGFNDIKPGDIIEGFEDVEIKRKL